MSKIVEVLFRNYPNNGDETLVARVSVPDNISDPLEYAWRWTNNIDGSWSLKDQYPENERNPDENPFVEVLAPLPELKGKKYGHRSSMVGDIFKMDGESHEVDMFGFKKV